MSGCMRPYLKERNIADMSGLDIGPYDTAICCDVVHSQLTFRGTFSIFGVMICWNTILVAPDIIW